MRQQAFLFEEFVCLSIDGVCEHIAALLEEFTEQNNTGVISLPPITTGTYEGDENGGIFISDDTGERMKVDNENLRVWV